MGEEAARAKGRALNKCKRMVKISRTSCLESQQNVLLRRMIGNRNDRMSESSK